MRRVYEVLGSVFLGVAISMAALLVVASPTVAWAAKSPCTGTCTANEDGTCKEENKNCDTVHVCSCVTHTTSRGSWCECEQ